MYIQVYKQFGHWSIWGEGGGALSLELQLKLCNQKADQPWMERETFDPPKNTSFIPRGKVKQFHVVCEWINHDD